ncbi:hypothetical protein fugu_016742 [Takifugu bimaculatus]|uniref:SH3 domain-containing protein n=1 Tax=Takifugu bimaculatus TaxID=433685 RepID=A0A4Z2BU88_9TELE|nr:hypothetical protein fugu_016742 [Takifugu bimaculatus]
MSVLQMYNILLQTVLLFVILPQLNLGLSDYKICGDSECESPMSRVQAIRDHHGTDCRFLNFKQGEIIFVYHKLTGKREDLWAGTIDKQFGYFPKNAVREEHFHTTMEIVVATQESDFFCMDEFGHLIDYSHLDRVGGETKVSTQDTETPQTTLPADDTNAESLSKFVSADSSATVQSLTTLNEMDGRKYEDATAAQGQTQPHNEKVGSASASWPGSSVTGWFGLTAVEKPESTTEQEEQGESQPEASFTSTMTGWLGLGGQEKPAVEDSVNTDSLASTMTRWLEFGGKEKTDHMSEQQQDTEKESGLEQEPAEKYRSRRMSMNIEDTQKETEGTSTLEWLGNGLSNRFGLSLSYQESEHMDPTLKDPKETPKEEEQPGSWFDIQDILGFNKGKIVVGSTESNVKGTEQRTGAENVNSGQSQPGLMEQVVAETNSLSEVAETQKDESQPSEREMSSASADSVTGDSNGDDLHLGTSDTSKDKLSSEGLAYRDAQKDISTVGETSSMFNSLFYVGRNEGVQDNIVEDSQKDMVPVDGEESAEMKDKNHQVPNTIEVEEKNREPGEENTTVPDQSFTTHSSASSDVLGPTACEDGKRADEEKAQTPDFKDSVDRFLTSRDRDNKGHDAERTLPDYNYPTAQDQGSKGEIDQIVGNQLIMSSGSAGEYREQVSHEDDNLTSQETGVAPFDSLLMTDKVAEAHPDRSEKEGEMLRAGDIAELIRSPQPADGSIKNMTVDVSEDNIGKTTQATEDDNTAGRKSESDADIDAGATMDGENIVGGDIIKGTVLQTSVDLQTEIKQMEKDEKTEDIMRTEEVKPPDNHQAEKEVEQEEIIAMGNGIEGEETQGEGEEINKDKVVVQGAQTQKGELTVEEEEVKKVETQQLVFGAKDEKLEDKVQESKEDLRKEDVTQAEERIDEGQSSPYLKADAESVIQSETQTEGSSGISTETEKGDAQALQDKEEGRHQEEKVKSTKEEDSQANEMIGSRDEPDCLMDRCSEAPANRDGNTLGTERSSTHLEGTQTGEQHPPTEKDQDITESLGRTDFESMEEEEEGRKQVEQDGYDSTANTESTGNISNVAESTKDSAANSKELLYSSVMNDDQLNSAEVEKTGYTEENTLHQGEKSDTEMVNNSTSKDHKVDTVDDSGKAEVLMTMEDDPASPNPGPEVRTETVNEVVVEDESGGGLSLLKGAFGYFSQTPATELVQNLDSNAGEVHGSLISEPELDSTDVYAQDVTTAPPHHATPACPTAGVTAFSTTHPDGISAPSAPHSLTACNSTSPPPNKGSLQTLQEPSRSHERGRDGHSVGELRYTQAAIFGLYLWKVGTYD